MDRGTHDARPATGGALFALLYRPGPRWARGEPLDRQPLAAHRAYLEGLARAGRIALAGPFLDAAAGFAVGAEGTIIHTVDGGKTWRTEASGTRHTLERLSLVSRTRGWAVGFGGTIVAYSATAAPPPRLKK